MKKQKKILLLLCVCCILVSIILRAFLIYGFISKFIISPREHEMICVSATVIPNYYFGDGMWMKIKERDSYGRYLFYSSFSDMGTDYYMIVVQASQDNKAYYYAEVCMLTTDSLRDLCEEEYEAFKACNDWGKPLNYEKMTWCEID